MPGANLQDEEIPDLSDPNDTDSVSTAEEDSEGTFDIDESDDNFSRMEWAFGAQVTFVDDNNNIVTMGMDGDDNTKRSVEEEFIGKDLSQIVLQNSNSDISHENDQKPAAYETTRVPPTLPLQSEGSMSRNRNASTANATTSNLAPKVPPSTHPGVSNEMILDWLEKQNPSLADSFAQEFQLTTS